MKRGLGTNGGRLRAVLGAAAVVAALAGPATALAGSGGQKASKPRVDADSVPGDYIQPEPVWFPVVPEGRGRPIYLGVSLRLHPSSDRRFDACVLAPHVTDWIVVDFSRAPPTRKDYDDPVKLRNRIEALIVAKAGRGLYRQVEVLREHRAPDEASAELSNMCK